MNKDIKIALVTDSCIDLPQEYTDYDFVRVVPLNITFPDGSTIQDGVDMTIEQFHKKVDESTDLPVTSQPSPEQFLAVYNEFLKNYDYIISLHLSSELSGTYNSAQLARQMIDDENKRVRIKVVDTKFASLLEGFVYIDTLNAIKENKSIEEILAIIDHKCKTMSTVFTVDTLDNLKKGGRVSHLSAILGGFLKVKPVMGIGCKTDGKIEAISKIRGRKKAIAETINIVKNRAKDVSNQKIGIMHSIIDYDENVDEIINQIKTELNPKGIIVSNIGATIGTHTGKGTIGIVFSEEAE
ncbi:MAG: DegV family protein [Clostridia bacterium]